jgi:hypothetical protein
MSPEALTPVPDCHCQHVSGGRCMFAARQEAADTSGLREALDAMAVEVIGLLAEAASSIRGGVADAGREQCAREWAAQQVGYYASSAVGEAIGRHRERIDAALTAGATERSLDVEPDWRGLLLAVVQGQEYDRMDAEGKAAEALGLTWDDGPGRWLSPATATPEAGRDPDMDYGQRDAMLEVAFGSTATPEAGE